MKRAWSQSGRKRTLNDLGMTVKQRHWEGYLHGSGGFQPPHRQARNCGFQAAGSHSYTESTVRLLLRMSMKTLLQAVTKTLLVCLLCFTLTGCWGSSVEEIRPKTGEVSNVEIEMDATKNWPWWQGGNRDNHAVDAAPPTSWSESKNILWEQEIPGSGLSSPIVCDGFIYLTTADESAETQSLLCLSQETGEIEWEKEIHRGNFDTKYPKNSQASSTPAWDGKHIFTLFINNAAIWVTAVTPDGEIKWQKKAGDFTSKHGYGSAPVVVGPLIIAQGDNSGGGFLTALDRETGEIVWRVRRSNAASFGTPTLIEFNDKEQLILAGQDDIYSYNPLTGEENWKGIGPSSTTANTVAHHDGILIASGGYPQGNVFAVNAADGSQIWQFRKKVYVPSPLIVAGREGFTDVVFAVGDAGVLYCLDLKTGKELWKERLSGDFSSSPVFADGKVYVSNETGTTFVFEANDKEYVELAKNTLPSGILASPALLGKRIYLRTLTHLYRVGEKTL
jgi:outer membrane protein assembly factor BamB